MVKGLHRHATPPPYRIPPGGIDRYLRRFKKRDERFPDSAGEVISSEVSRVVASLIYLVHELAIGLFESENEFRRTQGQYELLHPKTSHYDEAARLIITNRVLKYINSDAFDNIGGVQLVEGDDGIDLFNLPSDFFEGLEEGEETEQSDERSDSNDPHGGDLE